MPRIVPSQVVATIDKAFPGTTNAGNEITLGAGHATAVAAVYAQIRGLPVEFLAPLPPKDHALFVFAMAAIETALRSWETPAHSGLQVQLTNLGQLDTRQPLTIIREALERCPDTVPGLRAGALGFLRDADLAFALETDIATSESALANGEFKAAAVLAGSVAEALLLWAIGNRTTLERGTAIASWTQRTGRKNPPTKPEEWVLSQYIGIAGEMRIIKADTETSLALLQEYRNLIHPGRAQRLGMLSTRATATIAVGAMLRLVEELAA